METVYESTAWDGTKTVVRIDGDQMHVSNKREISDLLDQNAAIRAENGSTNPRNKDDWKHVARIDMMTYLKLVQEGIIGSDDQVDPKRFRQFLNDRDNSKFRTTEGRV
jgi:hypothetical protein